MLNNIVYVMIYGIVFASLYGIMTVGFSFVCGLGGFYDIALPAYFMAAGFLYEILSYRNVVVDPVSQVGPCRSRLSRPA